MQQDIERTCRKVTNLKYPRIKRTVNDEDDDDDKNPEQIFMVTVITPEPARMSAFLMMRLSGPALVVKRAWERLVGWVASGWVGKPEAELVERATGMCVFTAKRYVGE